MKTKYILSVVALTLGLTACENYFDEKYMDNGDPQIVVVENYDYTLTSDDYKTIANNKTNKVYAAYLDSIEGKNVYVEALALVGENRVFNENATADMYVPAYIYNKYPQVDQGSTFNVTYRYFEGLPEYLKIYDNVEQYKLTAADYKKIWGNSDTKYLTPATLAELEGVLPQVEDDHLLGVVYDYSSKEPDEGGQIEETREEIYIYSGGVIWKLYEDPEHTFVLLPTYAYGRVEKYLNDLYPYPAKDDKVVVMQYDSKAKKYVATEYNYDGLLWIANTGVIDESMSFVLAQGWQANLSTYYKQAVAGDGNMGKLTLEHYDLEDGITYIWAFNNTYGMKASAYYSGPHYGEGWCITPKIKLKNSTEPALSFDQAINYGPADETRMTQLTVWVSTDYSGNAHEATWVQLPWNAWDSEKGIGFPDANSWTFYNSGRMDLSAWNGQTIYIGFRYKSEPGQTCSTWEVKNILVNEPEVEVILD